MSGMTAVFLVSSLHNKFCWRSFDYDIIIANNHAEILRISTSTFKANILIFSILVTTNQKKKQLQNTDSFNPSLVYFSACAKQVGSLCRVTVDCGEASNISLDYAGSFSPQTDWLCFVRTIVHRVLCSQCSLSVFCKLSLNNTITWQLAAQSHYLHLKHSIQMHVYLIKESLNFPNLCSVIDKYLNQANVIRRTTSSHFVK